MIVGFIIHSLCSVIKGDYNIVHYTLTPIKEILLAGTVNGNAPMWFLLSLFTVKLIFYYVEKQFNTATLAIAAMVVTETMLIVFNYTGIRLPDYFCSIPMGLFFFSVGKMLSQRQYEIGIIVIAALLFASHFIEPLQSCVNFRSGKIAYGYGLSFIMQCVGGIVLINVLFKKIITPILFVSYVGQKSMIFYCCHWLAIMLVYFICHDIYALANKKILGIMIVVIFAVIPIVNVIIHKCKIQWIIGE